MTVSMPYTKRFQDTLYSSEWLRRVYIDENRNAAQVGALINADKSAVLSALRRHGIPVKDASEAQKLAPHPGSHAPRPRNKFKTTLHDKAWMTERPHLNASELAREAGCSVPAAQDALENAGMPVPNISEAKSGRAAPYKRKNNGELITRVIASRRANETCPPGPCVICNNESDDVNHIDYNWQNNDISNLERLCKQCHAVQHACESSVMIDVLTENGVQYRQIWEMARQRIVTGNYERKIPLGKLTVKGVTKSISQWSVAAGLSEGVVRRRLMANWDPERAVTEPVRQPDMVEYNGILDTIAGHARRAGIPVGNVYSRLSARSGWTLERALSVPINEEK